MGDRRVKVIDLDFDSLRSSGLLWKINHDVLHDLGLALAIEDCEDGLLRVSVFVSNEGGWEFDSATNTEKQNLFSEWYSTDIEPWFKNRATPNT